MGVAEILALVNGFFKFFPEIRKLIQVLSKTPAEKHAAVMAKINEEDAALRATGRPTWEG